MTPEDRELLLEATTTAWRPRLGGRIDVHPAWADLDEPGRHAAFLATRQQRSMEAAMDPDGLSTTARAVLGRIDRGGEPG